MIKTTIDEDCIKTYNDLKFRKIQAQYIIYELVKDPSEHIVYSPLPRKLHKSETKERPGASSSRNSLPMSPDTQCSTPSSSTRTE
jgi:hypothetical protein